MWWYVLLVCVPNFVTVMRSSGSPVITHAKTPSVAAETSGPPFAPTAEGAPTPTLDHTRVGVGVDTESVPLDIVRPAPTLTPPSTVADATGTVNVDDSVPSPVTASPAPTLTPPTAVVVATGTTALPTSRVPLESIDSEGPIFTPPRVTEEAVGKVYEATGVDDPEPPVEFHTAPVHTDNTLVSGLNLNDPGLFP